MFATSTSSELWRYDGVQWRKVSVRDWAFDLAVSSDAILVQRGEEGLLEIRDLW